MQVADIYTTARRFFLKSSISKNHKRKDIPVGGTGSVKMKPKPNSNESQLTESPVNTGRWAARGTHEHYRGGPIAGRH